MFLGVQEKYRSYRENVEIDVHATIGLKIQGSNNAQNCPNLPKSGQNLQIELNVSIFGRVL